MGFFTFVGMVVCLLLAGCVAAVLLHVIGNIYGGIKGAYRLRRITHAGGHWPWVKLGIKAWAGRRYKNGIGEYWQINGLIVPVDGRDKVTRSRFYGA